MEQIVCFVPCKTYELAFREGDFIGVVGEEDFGCSILESRNDLGHGIKEALGHLCNLAMGYFHVRPLGFVSDCYNGKGHDFLVISLLKILVDAVFN